MGEIPKQPFQHSFNASLKVDFQCSRVTSDGGLILVRELDERLGFGKLIEQHLTDSRRGKNTQFTFADLLRQSIYIRRAGCEDLNDAERLSQDPTFRHPALKARLDKARLDIEFIGARVYIAGQAKNEKGNSGLDVSTAFAPATLCVARHDSLT